MSVKSSRFAPALGRLEERAVPAGITAEVNSIGQLVVTGTDWADQITVRQVDGSPFGSDESLIFVDLATIRLDGVERQFIPASAVNELVVFGLGGNDSIDLASGIAETFPFEEEFAFGAQVFAGAGNDFVLGTANADLLFGETGNDRLRGLDGNDLLSGGAGNDDLSGGDGSDRLFGDGGRDTLNGGFGTDFLDGGAGDDTVNGNGDFDFFAPVRGRDVLDREPGEFI